MACVKFIIGASESFLSWVPLLTCVKFIIGASESFLSWVKISLGIISMIGALCLPIKLGDYGLSSSTDGVDFV